MRAIIKCATDLSDPEVVKEQLEAELKRAHWWPNLPQDHPILDEQRTSILRDVALLHHDHVRETVLFVILNNDLFVYGIVDQSASGALTFRLKHEDPEILMEACERLSRDLGIGLDAKLKGYIRMTPTTDIQVLEPNSQRTAFWGHYVRRKKWPLAWRDRRAEVLLGTGALFIALLSAALTIPPIDSHWLNGASVGPSNWHLWAKGTLERISTGFLITACVSWLSVLLHWRALKRGREIDWTIKRGGRHPLGHEYVTLS